MGKLLRRLWSFANNHQFLILFQLLLHVTLLTIRFTYICCQSLGYSVFHGCAHFVQTQQVTRICDCMPSGCFLEPIAEILQCWFCNHQILSTPLRRCACAKLYMVGYCDHWSAKLPIPMVATAVIHAPWLGWETARWQWVAGYGVTHGKTSISQKTTVCRKRWGVALVKSFIIGSIRSRLHFIHNQQWRQDTSDRRHMQQAHWWIMTSFSVAVFGLRFRENLAAMSAISVPSIYPI